MEEFARTPRSSKISVHVAVFQGSSVTNMHSYLLRDISYVHIFDNANHYEIM